jgi:hypothetical protein
MSQCLCCSCCNDLPYAAPSRAKDTCPAYFDKHTTQTDHAKHSQCYTCSASHSPITPLPTVNRRLCVCCTLDALPHSLGICQVVQTISTGSTWQACCLAAVVTLGLLSSILQESTAFTALREWLALYARHTSLVILGTGRAGYTGRSAGLWVPAGVGVAGVAAGHLACSRNAAHALLHIGRLRTKRGTTDARCAVVCTVLGTAGAAAAYAGSRATRMVTGALIWHCSGCV